MITVITKKLKYIFLQLKSTLVNSDINNNLAKMKNTENRQCFNQKKQH